MTRSLVWLITIVLIAAGSAASAQIAPGTTSPGNATSPVPAAPTEPPAAAPAPAQPQPGPAASPGTETSTPAVPPAADAENNAKVLAAIAALEPMIGDVQIMGPWVDGDSQGVWRTIMIQPAGETTGNRFFVQQVQEKDGIATVSSSTEVTEIADLDGAIVGYRADAPAEGEESNLTLFFDIVPLDGEVSETYELFVTPGQPYRFGPASN